MTQTELLNSLSDEQLLALFDLLFSTEYKVNLVDLLNKVQTMLDERGIEN